MVSPAGGCGSGAATILIKWCASGSIPDSRTTHTDLVTTFTKSTLYKPEQSRYNKVWLTSQSTPKEVNTTHDK